MTRYCEKCGNMIDEKDFYSSNNKEKYPDGKMRSCKKCMTMHVDNWDPETYKWILEEADVPYVKKVWDSLLEKYGKDPKKITGLTIIGRYLSTMKIVQYKDKRWKDSEEIEKKHEQEKIQGLRAQGYTKEEIEEIVSKDTTPPKPKDLLQQQPVGEAEYYDPEQEQTDYDLTNDDVKYLRQKWGKGYTPSEWVALEQLYAEFESSYDIQTAGHKDTLRKVCRASMRADQLMNAGDIDGAQKMLKTYNDLMKSGNFDVREYEKLYYISSGVCGNRGRMRLIAC